MDGYSKVVADFMDRLSEEDREIMDNITSGMYEAGMEEGSRIIAEEIKKNKQDRTTFGKPQPEDIEDLISLFPEMLDSYNSGVKEAIKYAGMVNVLSSVGVSMEVLETLVVNMMIVSESDKSEIELDSILEEESRKY